MSEVTAERDFLPVNIAVLTISDTRTLEDDKSGNILVDRIEGAGHAVIDRDLIKITYQILFQN